MKYIQTYNAIASEGLELFNKKVYHLNETNNPHGILLRSHSLFNTEFNDNLLAVARAGAGTNNIPIDDCTSKGIVVFNTPGANANAVKELILASLLLSVRPILQGAKWIQELESSNPEQEAENHKKNFAGNELEGKTLGIVGLGAIGSMVANDAYRLGMNVIGYDPFVSVETAWNISRRVNRAQDLDTVLRECDFITIHVPLNKNTRHLISTSQLSKMKSNAVLLNFARKELVDTEAVIEALDKKQIKSYVSDFADSSLLRRDDVLVLPHLGASTEEAEINCAKSAVITLSRFLETGDIVNSVNFPATEMPFNAPTRITLIHKNVPSMLGQISTVAANYKVNIENMINKSRNDHAYTMIDIQTIDSKTKEGLMSALRKIDGMIKVRLIDAQ